MLFRSPVIDRAIALSFLELMELRLVRELVDEARRALLAILDKKSRQG